MQISNQEQRFFLINIIYRFNAVVWKPERERNFTEENFIVFIPFCIPHILYNLYIHPVIICTTKPRGLCFTSLFPKLHQEG